MLVSRHTPHIIIRWESTRETNRKEIIVKIRRNIDVADKGIRSGLRKGVGGGGQIVGGIHLFLKWHTVWNNGSVINYLYLKVN